MIDYLVVGAGPAGLAFAQCAVLANKNVMVVDREESIGGCHRTRRVNGAFSEHGPRFYTSGYGRTKQVLAKANIDFFGELEPMHLAFDVEGITVSEWILLIYATLRVRLDNSWGKEQSMDQFMRANGFSNSTIEKIDRACRTSDGADATRFSVWKFGRLAWMAQDFFKLPRPTDEGLFAKWGMFLKQRGVDFALNTTVTRLIDKNTVALGDGRTLQAKNIVLAIPPTALVVLLNRSWDPRLFGDIGELATKTAYNTYVSVVLEYSSPIPPLPEGLSVSSWGIVFVKIGDRFVSAAATILDRPNSDNKTVNDSTSSEIASEINQVMREYVGVDASKTTFSPGLYHENGAWKDVDTAFVGGFANQSFGPRSSSETIFSIGTHNERGSYPATTMESAIQNAILFARELGLWVEPDPEDFRNRLFASQVKHALIIVFAFSVVFYIVDWATGGHIARWADSRWAVSGQKNV